MKRQGNLLNKIADLDNLYLAFYKAQKGKIAKPKVFEYSRHLKENLLVLQEQIVSGNVTFMRVYVCVGRVSYVVCVCVHAANIFL